VKQFIERRKQMKAEEAAEQQRVAEAAEAAADQPGPLSLPFSTKPSREKRGKSVVGKGIPPMAPEEFHELSLEQKLSSLLWEIFPEDVMMQRELRKVLRGAMEVCKPDYMWTNTDEMALAKW
jgi:hypothetical protein